MLGRVEIEIPYGSIRAASSAGSHSITLPSIPDFRAVGDLLRRRMRGVPAP